ncbi:MAG: restriction endonuclease subunit S [Anaerolineae bacterium]|nr:restriction endonuclease subunit S [Anaerolineae bacterium]
MLQVNGQWHETTLGEVIEIHDRRRIPLSSRERAERPGRYPYYGASGIIDHIDDYIFDGRYLLIAEDGENLNSRKTPIAFLASGKFWVNNHAHIVRARPGIADDYFLMCYLEASDVSGYITGTAQPKLSQTNLKAIPIRLPPLPIQRKIAAILSAYDDLIENNTRRIAILEEMAQAIYREWFVHFRFPGHENVEMVDSELGPIPEGWRLENLYDVSEVLTGYPFKSRRFTEGPEGMPVIRIRDIAGQASQTHTGEQAPDKYIVTNGDILVGMDGDFHMCEWAGGKAYLNQRVARVRPKAPIPWHYLFQALREPIEYFNSTITGTTVAHLGKKHLVTINILVPDERMMERARQTLEPVRELVLGLRLQSRVLSRTRDLLLPRLVSGEIDLSDPDIDPGELEV